MAPDCSARLPTIAIDEPGVPLPGAKVPPLATVTLPTVPVPATAPPLSTATVELVMAPLTLRVPALTVHGSAAVLVPVSVQVLEPVFSKMPKPSYCAEAPICDTSNEALVEPPSASVSAALNAITLPVIVEPA